MEFLWKPWNVLMRMRRRKKGHSLYVGGRYIQATTSTKFLDIKCKFYESGGDLIRRELLRYRMVKNIGSEKLWRIWRIMSNLPKLFLPIFTAFSRIVYGFRLPMVKHMASCLW